MINKNNIHKEVLGWGVERGGDEDAITGGRVSPTINDYLGIYWDIGL